MFIVANHSHGHTYVFLREIYFKDGKRKQRTVKSFGRLDVLQKKDPDILDKLKKKYQDEERSKLNHERERIVSELLSNTKSNSVTEMLTENQDQAVDGRSAGFDHLNYGLCLLRPVWRDWLKLSARLNYLANKTKIEYDVNEIAFYLAALKLLSPSLQLKAYEMQTDFLYNKVEGIHPRCFYQTLEFLYNNKDAIMPSVSKAVEQRTGRDFSIVYYDCTNCYFETDMDDRQLVFRDFVNRTKTSLQDKGLLCGQIDEYLQSPEFAAEAFEELCKDENSEFYYRMRGLSKEHRYDLPLVSVALVMDSKGIPIDFEVFPGNTSDFNTLPVSINALQRKYPIKNTVVVADRGLNSASNLKMLEDGGLGFLVAQKVSNLGSDMEAVMLDPQGYLLHAPQEGRKQAISSFDELALDEVAYKPHTMIKTARIDDPDNPGRKMTVELECTVIFTFSPSRKKRDISQLEYDIAKAQNAVNKQQDMKPCGAGWRSIVELVKEQDPEPKSEELPTGKKGKKQKKHKDTNLFKAVGIKEDVIAARRRLAGFGAVIYKKPRAIETPMAANQIFSTYRQLTRIEECFRIMKSNFQLRPMFVHKDEHVAGHVLLCVLALIMMRLLEIKLEENGSKLYRNEISTALNMAQLVLMKGERGETMFLNLQTPRRPYSHQDYLRYDKKAITDRWRAGRVAPSSLDKLIDAVELKPLNGINRLRDLNLKLGIRANLAEAIGSMLADEYQGTASTQGSPLP